MFAEEAAQASYPAINRLKFDNFHPCDLPVPRFTQAGINTLRRTTTDLCVSPGGCTLTVCTPKTFTPRGGRKLVVSLDGVPAQVQPRSRIDDTLVKALARAFRWRRLFETGAHGTVDEIARAEGINPSYVSRILRLTLLAPDIVDAILDGRQPPALTLARLMKPFPAAWEDQRTRLLDG